MTPDSFPHFSLVFCSREWVRRKNVLSMLMQCFMILQAMFAIITSALIVGAYAETGM
jgi:hypothetical protein